jgi:hypothetical protein
MRSMGTVSAGIGCRAPVHELQRAWCDPLRWDRWVEGLASVEEITGAWPQPGAAIRWRSVPAGRGNVTERVVRYEPAAEIESEIEDDQVVARQLVRFRPSDQGSHLEIEFAYRIKRRTPLTPLVDVLFVHGAMARWLRGTAARFAREFG